MGDARPGFDRPMQVLGVGLAGGDLASLDDALGVSGLKGTVTGVSDVRGAHRHLRDHGPIDCLVLSTGGAVQPTSEGAEELRNRAPGSALLAFTDDGDPIPGFDDVVGADDRLPVLLGRVLRSCSAIAMANARLAQWALHDPLTDVLNRRGLQRALEREGSRGERGAGPSSVLLVDCDDFKRVNDQFGLTTGDQALRAIADALSSAVRGADVVARVGGDEFLVLLPQTRTWEAVEVAERVRERVRSSVRLPDGTRLSVSIGVRRLDSTTRSVQQVIAAAQEGLTVSKAAGKDRVQVADDPAQLDEPSLPPTPMSPDAFTTTAVWSVSTGAVVRHDVRVTGSGKPQLALALQRAAQAAWDLAWFRLGLATCGVGSGPIHAVVYPSTLLYSGIDEILEHLPPGVTADRLVLSLDDQYLSGNPAALGPALDEARDHGMRLCLEVSDFARSSLESLVVLRPEVVRLAPELCRQAAHSRSRRAVLERLVGVAHALQVTVWATGVDRHDDRVWLAEHDVALASGWARPDAAEPTG